MNSFDEFAERALEIIPAEEEVTYDDLKGLWDDEKRYQTLITDSTFDIHYYPEDRIALEDAVMAIFGFDPDWRSPE